MGMANKHAPLMKFTVKAKSAPWIDTALKNLMSQRDEAKKVAVLSGFSNDRKHYCELRNHVTKINRLKKRGYYQKKIYESGNDGKKRNSPETLFKKILNDF